MPVILMSKLIRLFKNSEIQNIKHRYGQDKRIILHKFLIIKLYIFSYCPGWGLNH